MVTYRSFNDVVLNILSKLRLSQPNLDTKPSSVSRDIIDAFAAQVAEVYDELKNVADIQSIFNLSGADLTNLGTNFGLSRRTGSRSTGTGILTFRSIDTDITIAISSVGRTRGNDSFITTATTSVKTSDANSLRSTANRYTTELQLAGITDNFALEVTFQAQNIGSVGNISSYQLISHNIPNVNGITNITSFTGGSDLESDSAFRSRILSSFIGANTGTALGYRSIILNVSEIIDALVIQPGDPLMIRDGTDVGYDSDGNLIVTEPGSGGRVDIYVMGENPQSGTDSYIYRDQSGLKDPTNSKNNFIMGQNSLTPSTNLTINSRRVYALAADGTVPNQPIISISSVKGSSSGTNFEEEHITSSGITKGNYKIIKDTGSAGGSPFGLDKFAWISNFIELKNENRTKSTFNSVDPLAFTDVIKIPLIQQDIIITDENSYIPSSGSAYITLQHIPVKTVTRVFNLTTGERYVIAEQNPDGNTGDTNTTGKIKISGSTLPKTSDILQIDYIWIHSYDPYIDFDGLKPSQDRLNTNTDSIEWGFSNYIRQEIGTINIETNGLRFIETGFDISKVISVNTFKYESAVVGVNKKLVVSNPIKNIWEIRDNSILGNPEVYNTKANDGVFSNIQITMPSDTIANVNDNVNVLYNLVDYMNIDGYDASGRITGNKIILPTKTLASGTQVLINYVANFDILIPQTNITQLPIIGDSLNGFNNVDGYQPFQNEYSGSSIIKNIRRSPSKLKITSSNIGSNGVLSVVGTTINKVSGVFTVTSKNKIDFASLIRTSEGILSTAAIPSNITVSRVVNLQKVTTNSIGNITAYLTDYSLKNYTLLTNIWDKDDAAIDTTLTRSQMRLGSNQVVVFAVGTKLYAEFYYAKTNDIEQLYFSKDGIKITDKTFGYISGIDRISGFSSNGTVSGNIVVKTFNQPSQNDIYFVDYDYIAPKSGERITINYNYNKALVDGTNEIEEVRPITSDVLVKAAKKVELDVTAYIIVSLNYSTLSETVRQNVANNIASTLNAISLGSILDSSDIINNAYNVDGLDRIRIIKFNKKNTSGSKLSITAQKDEYLAAGIVTVTVESR